MTSPYEPIKKPPDFTTSDESLVEDEIAKAPFEVSGVRRLQLAGWPAPRVMDTLHMSLAAVLKVDASKIRLHQHYLGGGFGRAGNARRLGRGGGGCGKPESCGQGQGGEGGAQ